MKLSKEAQHRFWLNYSLGVYYSYNVVAHKIQCGELSVTPSAVKRLLRDASWQTASCWYQSPRVQAS